MSKQPTAAQKRKFGKVFEAGCMACLQDGIHSHPQIHHWRQYGNRDHNLIFGLCPTHHNAVSAVPWIKNRHLNPIEFAEKYGTDEELYRKCMELI
jgi:hypothetical protein